MAGYNLSDTIIARATPPGTSALAIVRLSGSASWTMLKVLTGADPQPTPRYSQTVVLQLKSTATVLTDVAVATCWRAPRSYTGEDMLELSLHGNPRLVEQVIQACVKAGSRPAEAGEFTYRALLNGKLNLSQAEAVQQLISAGSNAALLLASKALQGAPSSKARGWVERLTALLAGIEVIHDYAADDLDASLDAGQLLTPELLSASLQELCSELEHVLTTSRRSSPLREGISVAIAGPPNVGKSTLFNALLGYQRALTAPEPGTTRDYLTATVDTGELSLTLVDTAGYRDTTEETEAAGIALAADWLEAADKVLWVLAADAEPSEPPANIATDNLIRVVTRCDLLPNWPASQPDTLQVSGKTGQGIDDLWLRLSQVSLGDLDLSLAAFSEREAAQIEQALAELREAIAGIKTGLALDAASVHLYAAQAALTGIYQQADRGKVVSQIFSNFCVGK